MIPQKYNFSEKGSPKLSKLSPEKKTTWTTMTTQKEVSASELIPVHRAQLFNYMRLLKKPCGILVNFAPKFATIERYLFDLEGDNIVGMDGTIIQKL